MKIEASIADALSIGFGRAIGVCTVGMNVIKMTYDLFEAAVTRTWKGNEEQNAGKEEREIFALPGYRFERHLLFTYVGAIRATPYLGVAYSLARSFNYIQLEQNVDGKGLSLGAQVKGVN